MIPGITDRNRLPRLAKIRLGEKATNQSGKEYPTALDHFSFVDCPEVGAIYGKDCKELFPVLFPSDDEEVSFPTARKAYTRGGLVCACRDGKIATRVKTAGEDPQLAAHCKEHGLNPAEGEMVEMACPGQDCPWDQQDLCKPLGRLMFLLPKVERFGFYEICTTSSNSMINVLTMLRSMKAIVGRVAGIPFALKLVEQQVQPRGQKSKIVHVLQLEVRASLGSLIAEGKRLAAAGAVPLLPDPVDDVPDDLMPAAGARLEAKLDGTPDEPSRLKAIVNEPAKVKDWVQQTVDAKVASGQRQPGDDAEEGVPAAAKTFLTLDQRKELWETAKESGWSKADYSAALLKEGWKSGAEIPAEWFPVLMKSFGVKKTDGNSI